MKPIVRITLAVCLLSGCAAEVPYYHLPDDLSVTDDRFAHVVGSLLNSPVTEGNSVQTLVNGDEIFPAMLGAIRSAKQTITLESFVYWSGTIGAQFTDAVCERARAGVKVHVILDAVGSSKIDAGYVERMKAAGVRLVIYRPLTWTHLINITESPELNYRTHRKLLVVDGRVGFIGGVGIADHWLGDAQDERHWRDNHYRVTGPVVAQLQSAFCDNWVDTTGELLTGEHYYPPLNATGDLTVQMFMSSPESGGARNMQLMYLLFIASARQTLFLATPYFVLDQQSHGALIAARQRGVRVVILTPRQTDEPLVRHASRAAWGPLLDAGIEIYEYLPTLLHTKLMVVDDLWVSIGSANLDNRSFKLNDEANINVRDRAFALRQRRLIERDLSKAQRITVKMHEARPWPVQLWEGIVSLLSPQL